MINMLAIVHYSPPFAHLTKRFLGASKMDKWLTWRNPVLDSLTSICLMDTFLCHHRVLRKWPCLHLNP
jgi:hypothetical protein